MGCCSAKNGTQNDDIISLTFIEIYNILSVGLRDVLILDVQDNVSFKGFHINGSINISLDNIETTRDVILSYIKKKMIITESIIIYYMDSVDISTIHSMNDIIYNDIIPYLNDNINWLTIHSLKYIQFTNIDDIKAKYPFVFESKSNENITNNDNKSKSNTLNVGNSLGIPLKSNGNKKITFPSIIIQDKLFLGDSSDAKNYDILHALGITHILNITTNVDNYFEDKNITYKRLKILDRSNDETLKIFGDNITNCVEYIHNSLSQNNNNKVFVHCQFGISRSASMVIGYIMKYRNMTYMDAFNYVKQRRSLVNPNAGFVKQLKLYESSL